MKKLVVVLVAGLGFVFASSALAWTWPVDGEVVRPYSFGNDPYAAGQHRGVDIAAPPGSDVRAPASGVVTFGGFVPSGGRTLTIVTQAGYAVTLQQLESIGVTNGESVSEGQTVARSGPSSDSATLRPHVHLGVRVSGDRHGYVDPLTLLSSQPLETPPPDDAPPLDDAPPSVDTSLPAEQAIEPESGLEPEPAGSSRGHAAEESLRFDGEPAHPAQASAASAGPSPTAEMPALSELVNAPGTVRPSDPGFSPEAQQIEAAAGGADPADEEAVEGMPVLSTVAPPAPRVVAPLDSPEALQTTEVAEAAHAPLGAALDVPVDVAGGGASELEATGPPVVEAQSVGASADAVSSAPAPKGDGAAEVIDAVGASGAARSARGRSAARPRTSDGSPATRRPGPAATAVPAQSTTESRTRPRSEPTAVARTRALDATMAASALGELTAGAVSGLQASRAPEGDGAVFSSTRPAVMKAASAITGHRASASPSASASALARTASGRRRSSSPEPGRIGAAGSTRPTREANAAVEGSSVAVTLGVVLVALGVSGLGLIVRWCRARSRRLRRETLVCHTAAPLCEEVAVPPKLPPRNGERCEQRGRPHARARSGSGRVRRAPSRRTTIRRTRPHRARVGPGRPILG